MYVLPNEMILVNESGACEPSSVSDSTIGSRCGMNIFVQSGSDLEYGMASAVELVVYILEAQLGENGVVEHLPDSIHIHRSLFGVFAYALWNSAHLLLGSLLKRIWTKKEYNSQTREHTSRCRIR
jgi:hypothetical protein